MSSRVLAGLLAAGCLTAAAGGAYMAVRQNVVQPVPVSASPAPAPANPAAAPVSETEAIVTPAAKPQAEAAPAASPSLPTPTRETPKASAPPLHRESPIAPAPKPRPTPAPVAHTPPTVTAEKPAAPPVATPHVDPVQEPARAAELPPAPRVPQFEEVVLPSASVIGLEIETALSSERARVEDRVDAKVTRDVMADGHVAIPAGSRVIGSVTLVDRGGKVKTPARLGVRFHTLVLADGHEVSLHTEPIYREGESPAADSARKIGGAAVGGAILGAIIGGGKGAMIGGATGAAGGSAVVMAGDRNAATLNPGAVVNARLSAPVTLEVEKRDQH
jgi:Bacterial conjugation TrbI-like protein